MRTELSTVKMSKALIQRLKNLQRPHQALGGVIEELINGNACTDPDTMKRLERYRTHARETVGDLIKNSLDQLDEIEKQLAVKR